MMVPREVLMLAGGKSIGERELADERLARLTLYGRHERRRDVRPQYVREDELRARALLNERR